MVAIIQGPVRCPLHGVERLSVSRMHWFHGIVGWCFRVCPLCGCCLHLGESVKGGSTVCILVCFSE